MYVYDMYHNKPAESKYVNYMKSLDPSALKKKRLATISPALRRYSICKWIYVYDTFGL